MALLLNADNLLQNQQNQNYQARSAQQTAMLNGLFQLGSSAATAFSDRRLKRNILRIGKLASGLAVYAYQYLWSDKAHVGVMADENTDIAIEGPNGFKKVNYGLI